MFCNECVKTAGNIVSELKRNTETAKFWSSSDENVISVDRKQNIFHFTVESSGALSPEVIVMDAFDVILKKFDNIAEAIEQKIGGIDTIEGISYGAERIALAGPFVNPWK